MHKSSNASKKGFISSQSQPEQYKSETSKASSANKPKQKFSLQNIKDFKYEIDHQIAKCLDTLDRQGLKFLKQTLRASKIFGLNTQELTNTLPIQENLQLQSESLQVKQKSPSKKSNTKIIVVKKVTTSEQIKKQFTTAKAGRNNTKNNLGENIHKKLQSMNIKTGKKIDIKNQHTKKQKIITPEKIQHKSQNQIIQEIETQDKNQQHETINQNHSIEIQQQIKTQDAVHPQFKVQDKLNQEDLRKARHIEKQMDLFQQQNLITHNKPFSKSQFKKPQNIQSNKHILQDQGIKDNKGQDQGQFIHKSQRKPEFNIQRTVEQAQLNSYQSIQKSNEESYQLNFNFQKSQQNIDPSQKKIEPELLTLIDKINKLSPNKRGKLQRILQKLQQNPLIETSMLSIASNNSKTQPQHLKPYIPQKNSFFKQSNASEKNKSRSRLQKMQKATSIKDSLIKRINNQGIVNSPETFEKKNSQSRIQQSFQNQAILQFCNKANIKQIDKTQGKQQVIKLSSKDDSQAQKSLQNSISLIQQAEMISPTLIESGQKFIKIGKKRNQPLNVTLKILSNNGHPTLVSLAKILFYSQTGDIIQIQEANVKHSNQKIIKLFTLNNDSWTTQLSNAIISIYNILQPIGGIRIINFNKSEIQNNKQADLAQLFINQQLQWRGQLKGGSFKQGQQYITDIKISSKDFIFPNTHNHSITKSKVFFEQKSLKQSLIDLKQKKVRQNFDWLQKQSVYEKLKEIQQTQKSQSVTKKIQSIRNTIISVPTNKFVFQNNSFLQVQSKKNEEKAEIVISKNISRLKPRQEKGLECIDSPKEKLNKVVIKQSKDILGEISQIVGVKRKNDSKQQLIICKQNRKMKEYRIQKQKQQDNQFQQILRSLQQREKDQQAAKKNSKQVGKKTNENCDNQTAKQKKGKALVQQNMEQFMKDSLFDDFFTNKKAQIIKNNSKQPKKNIEKPQFFEPKEVNFNKNNNNLDQLIEQLNDVVGNQKIAEIGEDFCIPQLPTGKQLTFVILSNWGNQQFYGLNGIEVFDVNGDLIKPIKITSISISGLQLLDKLCKPQFLTSDQYMQIKLPRSKKSVLNFNFAYKIEVSAIRIWNYNGHRVHSNIGVRKCHLKLDNVYIFSGEIQQSTGSSEDAFKYCQYILFTQNNNILKKISDKDWLNKKKNSNQRERMLFKSTLENFHRPVTRNDEQNVTKQTRIIQMKKQIIKLPKRMCSEYEPSQLPEGFTLKLVLHSSWGDHFFIGLNGIQIFNEEGQNITKQNLIRINAEPSSISHLAGYEGDNRIVNNLINGKNNTTSNSDIWLTPLLSDVQKIQKGISNYVFLEYAKLIKISGINFYNYVKTPQRGVRQIQIYLDKYLLYRGYLRKYNEQQGIIHTTINFTKEQILLQAMHYVGYNEDHLQQDVSLINEGKIIKQVHNGSFRQHNLLRPMTGKLLN